jgi:8-oxo-dGTP diphosphatase
MLKELFHLPYHGRDVGYVIVIARTKAGGRIAVVQKKRPSWQAGRFNFPGGKIEPRESPVEAAAREMWEETGVTLSLDSLRPVAQMLRPGDFELYVFAAETPDIANVETKTDELITLVDEDTLRGWSPAQCLENLAWMYGMAFDGVPKCARIEYDVR